MQHDPDTIRLILTTFLLLHNLMRTCYPVLQNNLVDRKQNGRQIPGAWRQDKDLLDTRVVQAPNRSSKDGKMLVVSLVLRHCCRRLNKLSQKVCDGHQVLGKSAVPGTLRHLLGSGCRA